MNLRPDVAPSALPHLGGPCTVLSLSRTVDPFSVMWMSPKKNPPS